MKKEAKVAVVMGSDSDLPVMEATIAVLERFDVPFELHVMSAHRSPKKVHTFGRDALARGIKAIIAGAGGAAHLAGTLAAVTPLPVIGVPMPTGRMGGLDSLLSTVQMPSGVPVATVGIGESGASNAAYLAIQILATEDETLREAIVAEKARMARAVTLKDKEVQEWLRKRRAET